MEDLEREKDDIVFRTHVVEESACRVAAVVLGGSFTCYQLWRLACWMVGIPMF